MFGKSDHLKSENELLKKMIEKLEKDIDRLTAERDRLALQTHEAYLALVSKYAPNVYFDKTADPLLKEAHEKTERELALMKRFVDENEQEQLINNHEELASLVGGFLAGAPPKPVHGGGES